MTDACYYCGVRFQHPDDLRPYGPEGAMVCYDCATATPERAAEAQRRMDAILSKAMEDGGGAVRLGGGLPRPALDTRDGDTVLIYGEPEIN